MAAGMAKTVIRSKRALNQDDAVTTCVNALVAVLGLVKPKHQVEPREMANLKGSISSAGYVNLVQSARIAYDSTGGIVSINIVDAPCESPGRAPAARIVRVAPVLPKKLAKLTSARDAELKTVTTSVLPGRVDTLAADCVLHGVGGAVIVCYNW